jgi:hypothetical protein
VYAAAKYPHLQEEEFEEQATIKEEGGVNYYLEFNEQSSVDL